MTRVDEIADGIFRVNTPVDETIDVSFFLVRDNAPTLVGTGFRANFDVAYTAIRRLVRPSLLRYVVVPHVESDESGALNQFLDQAPYAQAIGSPIGVETNLGDLADAEALPVDDSDVLDLGMHRLRFVIAPYVHQWDSLFAYDYTTGTLFASDLFITPPSDAPMVDRDDSEAMVALYHRLGIFPSRPHLDLALDKIEALSPTTLACHHGPVKIGQVQAYLRATRECDLPIVTSPQPSRSLLTQARDGSTYWL